MSLAHCHCGHWLAATGPRARHHCQWRPLRLPAGRASPVSPSGSGGPLPTAGAAGVAVPLLRVRATQLALGHWQNTAPGRYPPAPRGRGTRASIRPDRNRAGRVVSFRSSAPRPSGSFVDRQLRRTHSAVVHAPSVHAPTSRPAEMVLVPSQESSSFSRFKFLLEFSPELHRCLFATSLPVSSHRLARTLRCVWQG